MAIWGRTIRNVPFAAASSSSFDLTSIDSGSFDNSGATGAYTVSLISTSSSTFASFSALASQTQIGSLEQSQTASTHSSAGSESNLTSLEATLYTPTTQSGIYSTVSEARSHSSYSVEQTTTSAYEADDVTSSTLFHLAADGHAESNVSERDAGVTTTGGDQGVYYYHDDGSSYDHFEYSSESNSTWTSASSSSSSDDTFEVVDVATSSYTDDQCEVYSGDELAGWYQSRSVSLDTLTVDGHGVTETDSTYGYSSAHFETGYDFHATDVWTSTAGAAGR